MLIPALPVVNCFQIAQHYLHHPDDDDIDYDDDDEEEGKEGEKDEDGDAIDDYTLYIVHCIIYNHWIAV